METIVKLWGGTFLALGLVFLMINNGEAYDRIEKAGDIIQMLLPATAYGITYLFNDQKGRSLFYKSFLTDTGMTQTLKGTVNKPRPNGSPHSFPSGHTSAASCGAAFIQQRYGWKYGITAYVGVALVGYSRVESFNHFPSDVMAGAGIGILSSYIFTKPGDKGIQLVPMIWDNNYCLVFNYKW